MSFFPPQAVRGLYRQTRGAVPPPAQLVTGEDARQDRQADGLLLHRSARSYRLKDNPMVFSFYI